MGIACPFSHSNGNVVMSKKSTALIVVLLCVIGIQARLLHQAKTPVDKTGAPHVSAMAKEGADRGIDQNDMSNQLARIDARLSAIETSKPAPSAKPEQAIILGSPEARAADRKIAALLPDGPISQQELFLIQTQLAQYPSSEQAQLSAALARAINNGNVQIAATP